MLSKKSSSHLKLVRYTTNVLGILHVSIIQHEKVFYLKNYTFCYQFNNNNVHIVHMDSRICSLDIKTNCDFSKFTSIQAN